MLTHDKKEIIYVSYYSLPNDPEKRNSVLSCTDKMDYIISCIRKYGYKVKILSASEARNEKVCRGREVTVSEGVELYYFKSFPWTTYLSKMVCFISIMGGLLKSLLKVRRNSTVIVYHSLPYMSVIRIAHFIKRFHLVLEVEEIYSDVTGNKKLKKRELSYFKCADSYLFPTESLNRVINTSKKPYTIIYGVYRTYSSNLKSNMLDFANNNMIHCVYAGTLDPRKGGAVAAAAAAEYLPDNYHIHILGFGSSKDVQNITEVIRNISQRSKAFVSYEGVLTGDQYNSFIQKCSIGLSTQDPNASFNHTSFPSKILSYLSNGLRVVTIRIPVVEESSVGDILYYYDEQDPKHIAEAIRSVDMNQPYDSTIRIKEFDEMFTEELYTIISSRRNNS